MKNSNLFLASKELENIDIDFGDEIKEENKKNEVLAAEITLNIKNKNLKILGIIESYKKEKFKTVIKLRLFDLENNLKKILFDKNEIVIKQINFEEDKYNIERKIKKISYKNKNLKIVFNNNIESEESYE